MNKILRTMRPCCLLVTLHQVASLNLLTQHRQDLNDGCIQGCNFPFLTWMQCLLRSDTWNSTRCICICTLMFLWRAATLTNPDCNCTGMYENIWKRMKQNQSICLNIRGWHAQMHILTCLKRSNELFANQRKLNYLLWSYHSKSKLRDRVIAKTR